jgi:hypothetical protein
MVICYQSNPKQSHLEVFKRIFKYLKGTMTYGLWYPRNHNLQLTAYSDVDWAICWHVYHFLKGLQSVTFLPQLVIDGKNNNHPIRVLAGLQATTQSVHSQRTTTKTCRIENQCSRSSGGIVQSCMQSASVRSGARAKQVFTKAQER